MNIIVLAGLSKLFRLYFIENQEISVNLYAQLRKYPNQLEHPEFPSMLRRMTGRYFFVY